jgi:hypothetical protein
VSQVLNRKDREGLREDRKENQIKRSWRPSLIALANFAVGIFVLK